MRFPCERYFAFFLPLLWAASPASAMTVTPTQIEMVSAGRQSRSMITVVNDGARPLPVEIVIKKVSLDERGLHTDTDSNDEFLVMPPQALIAPGATQIFRVQWLGEPLLERSQSFFFYVNQIPVKQSKRAHDVQLVFSIGVMVNVAPPRGEPALNVIGSAVVTDDRGRRHPVVTVENRTNIHAIFAQSTVRVSSGHWSEIVSGGALEQSVGIGLVQPGRRRRFILPITLPDNVATVQYSLEFRGKP